MDFWRTISILSKRKWLITLSVLITAGLTLAASRMVGSKWVATARFAAMDTARLSQMANGQQETSEGGQGMEPFEAQAAVYGSIVASREVIEPALRDQGILYDPEDIIDSIEFEATAPRMFALKITDNDPMRAKIIANALSKQFIVRHKELTSDQAKRLVALLQDQLRDVDYKLRAARQAHDAYKAKHQLIGANNQSMDNVFLRLSGARQQRDQQAERLASLRAQYQHLLNTPEERPAQPPVIEMQEAPAVEQIVPQDELLLQELAAVDAELAGLNERYTSSHPKVKDADARREGVVRRIDAARATAAAMNRQRTPALTAQAPVQPAPLPPGTSRQDRLRALRGEISGVEAQVGVLTGNIARLQSETERFKGVDGPLAALAGSVNEHSEARANLVGRLNAAKTAMDVNSRHSPLAITALVDDFNPVLNATQGRTKKLMMMAILCALLGTSGLVVAFDSIDRRLRNVKEAQSALPSRVIAAIPQPMGAVTYADLARATELQPKSIHAEAYRFLAQHLLSPNGPRARSLMVVSAKGDQGSTTTLTNLAITLAQAGKRVILVDANVRTAELHQVFHTETGYGYVDLLNDPDGAALDEAIQPTSIPNLEVITAGSSPDNPWQVFRSSNIKTVSDKLLARADFVLYDTPSALLFTDALNVASVVDGAFMCVRALETLTGEEQRLMTLLEQANVEVLGSVLTDVPMSVLEGYDNYRHYYGGSLHAAIAAPSNGSSEKAEPMFVTPAGSGESDGKA